MSMRPGIWIAVCLVVTLPLGACGGGSGGATGASGSSGASGSGGGGGSANRVNYFRWDAETDLPLFGGTTRDCTVAHSGSCSMRLNVMGDDAGNQPMGAETNPFDYSFGFVNGPALYYRWWMRIEPGFSWGSGTAKTKASRVLGGPLVNGSGYRGYTGYLHATDGFVISGCDVGAAGGCLDANGNFAGGDHRIKIPYDFRPRADGQWHEYIVKIKSNTSATCTPGVTCDAQFEAWVDGVSVGQYNNFRLHDDANHTLVEAWGGWMLTPYFQLNGTISDGGTIYVDDVSTDTGYNSLLSSP